MEHIYLSQEAIAVALAKHVITEKEARKLLKKMNSQASIYKSLHKDS